MAYLSRIVTPGTGSVYTITIPYLERTHITCFVNGILRSFVWDTDTQITLNGFPPGGGDTVEIIRNTPDNLVQFQDGSTLDEILLNVFDLVHQYQNEEFLEDVRTEELDMGSNKIVNVTDPTLAQDAATKAYVDAEIGTSSTADQAYADGLDAANSVTDQAYADAQDVINSAADRAYADGEDASHSAADRSYTDAADVVLTNALVAYADTVSLEGGVPGVSQSFYNTAGAGFAVNTPGDNPVGFIGAVFDVGAAMSGGLVSPNKAGTYLLTAEIVNLFAIGATDVYEFKIIGAGRTWSFVTVRGADNIAAKQAWRLSAVVESVGPPDTFNVTGGRVSGSGTFIVTGSFSGSFLHG